MGFLDFQIFWFPELFVVRGLDFVGQCHAYSPTTSCKIYKTIRWQYNDQLTEIFRSWGERFQQQQIHSTATILWWIIILRLRWDYVYWLIINVRNLNLETYQINPSIVSCTQQQQHTRESKICKCIECTDQMKASEAPRRHIKWRKNYENIKR